MNVPIIFLFVLVIALLYLVKNEVEKRGKEEEDVNVLEATNEKLSNRPLTDDDLIKRLRSRAANERADSSKS